MVVSITSPTGAAGAAASAASRREKMTSLITWAISPCCASAAILVLQDDRVSAYTRQIDAVDRPVLDALRELVLLRLLLLRLLALARRCGLFVDGQRRRLGTGVLYRTLCLGQLLVQVRQLRDGVCAVLRGESVAKC
jgi:hypothetical protein